MESQEERRARFERERAERTALLRKVSSMQSSYTQKCQRAQDKGLPLPDPPIYPQVESSAEFWSRWAEYHPGYNGKADTGLIDGWTEWKQLPPEDVERLSNREHRRYCELWCEAHPIKLEELAAIRQILLNEK